MAEAQVPAVAADGTPITLPKSKVPELLEQDNTRLMSQKEAKQVRQDIAADTKKETEGDLTAEGVAETWLAGLHGAERGVAGAFGVPLDAGIKGVAEMFGGAEAGKKTADYLKRLEEDHPYASGWMEAMGGAQGGIGAAELVGAPGRLSQGLVPGAGGLAARAAYGGVENVVQSTTRDINEDAIGKASTNGEKLWANAPKHFVVGAGLTLAGEGLGKALEAGVGALTRRAEPALESAASKAVGREMGLSGEEAAVTGGRIREATAMREGTTVPASRDQLLKVLVQEQAASRKAASAAHEARVSEMETQHIVDAAGLAERRATGRAGIESSERQRIADLESSIVGQVVDRRGLQNAEAVKLRVDYDVLRSQLRSEGNAAREALDGLRAQQAKIEHELSSVAGHTEEAAYGADEASELIAGFMGSKRDPVFKDAIANSLEGLERRNAASTMRGTGAKVGMNDMIVADRVFAGSRPDAWKPLANHPAGYRVGIDRIHADAGQIELYGKVFTNEGRFAGEFGSTFRRDGKKLIATTDNLLMEAGHQGSGVGATIAKNMDETYRRLGVNEIELRANQVGRYYWAKQGYQWSERTGKEMEQAFGGWLAKNGHDIREAGVALKGAKELADSKYGKAFLTSDDAPVWFGRKVLSSPADVTERAAAVAASSSATVQANVERLSKLREHLQSSMDAVSAHLGNIAAAEGRLDGELAKRMADIDKRAEAELAGIARSRTKGLSEVESSVSREAKAYDKATEREFRLQDKDQSKDLRGLGRPSQATEFDPLIDGVSASKARADEIPLVSGGGILGAVLSAAHGNPFAAISSILGSLASGRARAHGNLSSAQVLVGIADKLRAVDKAIQNGAASVFGRTAAKAAAAEERIREGKAKEIPAKKRTPSFDEVSKSLLAAQANPDLIRRHVEAQHGPIVEGAPQTYAAVLDASMRAQHFLMSMLPMKQRDPNSLRPDLTESDVSPTEKYDFMQYVGALSDPLDVFKDVRDGTVTEQQVEAIRNVIPELYAQMQQEVMWQNQSLTKPLPYEKEIHLGTLLGVNTDQVLDPEFQALQKDAFVMKEESGAPVGSKAPSGDAKVAKNMMSASQEAEKGSD